MSFSGAERGAEKTVSWLNLKFNSPHILMPKVYEEIKNLAPARSVTEVPRTAERVFQKIEALSVLMNSDETQLPADVTQAIFRSLFLSIEEKKQILHYLETERNQD